MKKAILLLLFLCANFLVSAQNHTDFGYDYEIRKLDVDDYYLFFYNKYEINPTIDLKTLTELEKESTQNKNPNITYNFQKLENNSTKVSVRVNNYLFSEATYAKNVLDGTKTIYHTNSNPFQVIEYKKGKVDGTYKMFNNINNELVLETHYKDNLKDGKRTLSGSKRNKEFTIVANYKKDQIIGDLIITKDQETYNYPNDLKKGTVKRYENNVLVNEYEVIGDNKIHGLAKVYSIKTGKIIAEIPHVFDKKHGVASYFDKEGVLLTKNEYKYDKKIGTHKIYFRDQLIEVQNFDEFGNETGIWEKYYTNGTLERTIVYDANGTHEITSYDGNQKIRSVAKYTSKNKEIYSKTYKNGVLENEFFKENGKTIKAISYYANGAIFTIETPKGERYEREFYDKNGKLVHKNKVNEQGKNVGVYKNAVLKEDEMYLYDEYHYDDNGIKTKWIYKMRSGKMEYNYRNNTQHGPKITYDDNDKVTLVEYYFEENGKSKIVTKEEFEQRTKAEKK